MAAPPQRRAPVHGVARLDKGAHGGVPRRRLYARHRPLPRRAVQNGAAILSAGGRVEAEVEDELHRRVPCPRGVGERAPLVGGEGGDEVGTVDWNRLRLLGIATVRWP